MGINLTQLLLVAIGKYLSSKSPTSTALWHVVWTGSNCQIVGYVETGSEREIESERERLESIRLASCGVELCFCERWWPADWKESLVVCIVSLRKSRWRLTMYDHRDFVYEESLLSQLKNSYLVVMINRSTSSIHIINPHPQSTSEIPI